MVRTYYHRNAIHRSFGNIVYAHAETFAMTMDLLTGNSETRRKAGEAAGEYIRSNAGAADRIFNSIKW